LPERAGQISNAKGVTRPRDDVRKRDQGRPLGAPAGWERRRGPAAEGAARYRAQLSGAIPTDDADVRAALISTTLIGVIVSRHLLKFDDLRDAPPEQIIDLLRPCLRSLTHADD